MSVSESDTGPPQSFFQYLCSFFSCKRYSELASQSLDGPLTPQDKVAMWFHHGMCLMCRRYRRQIILLNQASGQWEQHLFAEGAEGSDQVWSLSTDARNRLQQALELEMAH